MYHREYIVSIRGESVVITKNPLANLTRLEDFSDIRKRYPYKEGQKVLTPNGVETIREIIWIDNAIILVEENRNHYKITELDGVVVKELSLELWNQVLL